MPPKCTILISSCDSYEDAWHPFFFFFNKEWPDYPKTWDVVLNTESKSFSFDGMDIKTFNFYKPKRKVKWGRRLIKTLRHLSSEYVLFLLDDFFFTGKVDQKRIEQCIEWMEQDPQISVFSFWRTRGENIRDGKYPNFELRPQEGDYRMNCQAAIWRREKLIEYIRPHEDPWQWEYLGSKRSSRYHEKFYSAIEDEPYIMTYDWFSGGAIHRGKWTKGAALLFKENGIHVDLSKRGLENANEKTKGPEITRAREAMLKAPLSKKTWALIQTIIKAKVSSWINTWLSLR